MEYLFDDTGVVDLRFDECAKEMLGQPNIPDTDRELMERIVERAFLEEYRNMKHHYAV